MSAECEESLRVPTPSLTGCQTQSEAAGLAVRGRVEAVVMRCRIVMTNKCLLTAYYILVNFFFNDLSLIPATNP